MPKKGRPSWGNAGVCGCVGVCVGLCVCVGGVEGLWAPREGAGVTSYIVPVRPTVIIHACCTCDKLLQVPRCQGVLVPNLACSCLLLCAHTDS
jgi:hypothetical protein